jgi:glycosyltransferase 2 family protein
MTSDRPTRNCLKWAIRILLIAGVVWFWVRFARASLADIETRDLFVGWLPISLSAGLFLLGYVLLGILWRPLLRSITGFEIGYLEAFRVSAISWMGRYIPGKAWALAAKAWLSAPRREQLPATAVAVVIETLWQMSVGVLLVLVLSLVQPVEGLIPKAARPALIILAVVGIGLLHPRPYRFCVALVLRVLRREPPEFRMGLCHTLGLSAGYAAVFLLWSLGVFVYADAVAGLGIAHLAPIAAAFTAAFLLGFLALLVPAGIGVRETAFAVALGPLSIPAPLILVIVVGARLLPTLIELLCFLAAWVLSLRRGRGLREGAPVSREEDVVREPADPTSGPTSPEAP